MDETTLVARIPQVGGFLRSVCAQNAAHAGVARQILRENPAMIDGLHETDGIRLTLVDSAFEADREAPVSTEHKHRFEDRLEADRLYTYGPRGNPGQESRHWRIIARCGCGLYFIRNDRRGERVPRTDDDWAWVQRDA